MSSVDPSFYGIFWYITTLWYDYDNVFGDDKLLMLKRKKHEVVSSVHLIFYLKCSMRTGGYLGTDGSRILNWRYLQNLKADEKFGGGWIVAGCTKLKVRKSVMLVLTLEDTPSDRQTPDIVARVYKCPATTNILQTGSLLVINPVKGSIKQFNGRKEIHVYWRDTKVVLPHEIKEHLRSPRSPRKVSSLCIPSILIPIISWLVAAIDCIAPEFPSTVLENAFAKTEWI